jgi:hypothetical protein
MQKHLFIFTLLLVLLWSYKKIIAYNNVKKPFLMFSSNRLIVLSLMFIWHILNFFLIYYEIGVKFQSTDKYINLSPFCVLDTIMEDQLTTNVWISNNWLISLLCSIGIYIYMCLYARILLFILLLLCNIIWN